MDDVQLRLRFRHVVGYILAYLLWVVAIAVSMLAVLEARNALNVVWPLLGSGVHWQWVLRPVDRFGLVFAGIAWLVYTIFAEEWFRVAITAVRRREQKGVRAPALLAEHAVWPARYLARLGLDVLASRFVRAIVPVVGVLLVSLGVKSLAFRLLTG
jgi:hypothetical protein